MQRVELHVCMNLRPMVLSMICLICGLDTLTNHWETEKTNMVLSDLILGWSQLVTGHADSLIISYILPEATCKVFSLVRGCERREPRRRHVQCVIGSLWEKRIASLSRVLDMLPGATERKRFPPPSLQCSSDTLRKSYMWYLYYPWYMQICVFFLPVQVNIPAGLKGQEVTRYLLPSILPTRSPNLMAQFVR